MEQKKKRYAENFEDLEVFQIAFSCSLDLHKLSLEFPKIEQYSLADQLRRSSKSVCVNIAEGFGKQRASRSESRRFLLIALGSSDEVQVWLKYCLELQYIDPVAVKGYQERYKQISRMLQALCSSLSNDR